MVNTARLAIWFEAHRCDLFVCVYSKIVHRFYPEGKNDARKRNSIHFCVSFETWHLKLHPHDGTRTDQKKKWRKWKKANRVMAPRCGKRVRKKKTRQQSTGCWRFCDVFSNTMQERCKKPGCATVETMRMDEKKKSRKKEKNKNEKTA